MANYTIRKVVLDRPDEKSDLSYFIFQIGAVGFDIDVEFTVRVATKDPGDVGAAQVEAMNKIRRVVGTLVAEGS